MLDKYRGQCGCGAIEYAIDSDIKSIVNCHCSMCRDHNGSSYSTYVVFPFKELEITKGSEFVGEYKLGTGSKRFCKKCGTPLFNTNKKYSGLCMIYLGTLNAISDLIPRVNVWCDSKLGWIDGVSEIPSLSQGVESKSV